MEANGPVRNQNQQSGGNKGWGVNLQIKFTCQSTSVECFLTVSLHQLSFNIIWRLSKRHANKFSGSHMLACLQICLYWEDISKKLQLPPDDFLNWMIGCYKPKKYLYWYSHWWPPVAPFCVFLVPQILLPFVSNLIHSTICFSSKVHLNNLTLWKHEISTLTIHCTVIISLMI